METGLLDRDEVRSDVIRGTLTIADKTFQILERPWKDNLANESCIPAGEYMAEFLAETTSGKFKNVYELQSVPGRTDILIHNGNVVEHTHGCLIIGLSRGDLDGKPAVLDSQIALTVLVDTLGRNPFLLKISETQNIK